MSEAHLDRVRIVDEHVPDLEALRKPLAERFGIAHVFVDDPNPI